MVYRHDGRATAKKKNEEHKNIVLMILTIVLPTTTAIGEALGILLDRVTNGTKGSMVTIITEKLRNQTLEEAVQFSPIPQTRTQWEVSTGESRVCPLKDEWPEEKNWEENPHNSPLPLQPEHQSTQATLPSMTTTTQSLSSMMSTSQLTFKSKTNVAHGNTIPPRLFGSSSFETLPQLHNQKEQLSMTSAPSCWQHYQSMKKHPQHMMQASFDNKDNAKLSSRCLSSFSAIFTPGTPPDPPKKRHCRSLSIPESSKSVTQWQPQASSIWKPVAIRSHHGPSKSHHSSSKLIKSRNSPLHLHHKHRFRSASPSCNNVSSQGQNGTRFSPAHGMFSGNETYTTPPESPVPRPASASSGFYDSSASQTSLNISWTEGCFNSQNSFSPHPPRSKSASGGSFHNSRTDFKWERSLSVEEPISGHNKFGMQQMTSGNIICNSNIAAHSMPVINLAPNCTPSSPRRNRVPRCRSQPCVLSDRKMGLKRRRGEERPSINFKKMTETSFPYSVPHNRPKSVTFAQDIQEILDTNTINSLYPEKQYHVLDPIASSPLDTPSVLLSGPQKQTLTNPDPSSTASLLVTKTAKSSIPTGAGNGAEDVQWDSGCSDTNDPPDLFSFGESENSCSFNDDPGASTDVDVTDDNEDQQFQLEMSGEIDLDQIEKD